MRIEDYSDEKRAKAWRMYEDFRDTRFQNPGAKGDPSAAAEGTAESMQTKQVNGTEGCKTCEGRKYQDGSDDPGVSFKAPTKIAPEQAASAVRGHEMEHVGREKGKAAREDRKVVSQSVTYHNAICAECGSVYVSGGTTRTTTASKQEAPKAQGTGQGKNNFEAYA